MQHFESTNQGVPFPPEIVNPIQLKLIEQSQVDPALWIQEHGQHFRALIEQHPEIVALYQLNPTQGFEKISQLLKISESKKETLH
jgi:hypothetical protein